MGSSIPRSLYGLPNSGSISSCHSFVACLKGSRLSIFGALPGHVPVDTGTASVPTGLDQAALTSIVLGVAACGAGTLTSTMPFVYFASTWAASTPSGRAKLRWNAPYATSRTK